MAWVPMCGYVHGGAGAHGGQKGVSGSPELELQAVASRLSCVLGITLRTFGRAGFALNCSATSPTLARALGSSTPRSGFHDSAFPCRFPTLILCGMWRGLGIQDTHSLSVLCPGLPNGLPVVLSMCELLSFWALYPVEHCLHHLHTGSLTSCFHAC